MKTASVFKLLLAAVTGVGLGFLLAPGRSARVRKGLREKGQSYLKGGTYACMRSLKRLKYVLTPLFDKHSDPITRLPEKEGEKGRAHVNRP